MEETSPENHLQWARLKVKRYSSSILKEVKIEGKGLIFIGRREKQGSGYSGSDRGIEQSERVLPDEGQAEIERNFIKR